MPTDFPGSINLNIFGLILHATTVIPLSHRLPAYRYLFYVDRLPVQSYLDTAYLGKLQQVCQSVFFNLESCLVVCERVVLMRQVMQPAGLVAVLFQDHQSLVVGCYLL
jgi:hypothetical protein